MTIGKCILYALMQITVPGTVCLCTLPLLSVVPDCKQNICLHVSKHYLLFTTLSPITARVSSCQCWDLVCYVWNQWQVPIPHLIETFAVSQRSRKDAWPVFTAVCCTVCTVCHKTPPSTVPRSGICQSTKNTLHSHTSCPTLQWQRYSSTTLLAQMLENVSL